MIRPGLTFGLALVLLLAVACSYGSDSETVSTPTPTISPAQEPITTAVVEPVELTGQGLLAEIKHDIE